MVAVGILGGGKTTDHVRRGGGRNAEGGEREKERRDGNEFQRGSMREECGTDDEEGISRGHERGEGGVEITGGGVGRAVGLEDESGKRGGDSAEEDGKMAGVARV